MRNDLKCLYDAFAAEFGDGGYLFFSPSRINIIGEHIDYNGGSVLPCAIEIGTYAIVRKRDDGIVRLRSLNIAQSEDFDVCNIVNLENATWLNYVAGMLKFIGENGHNVGGFEGVIFGNIPNGAGLSSSASVELLIGAIANEFFNDGKISQIELVKLGQRTENEFIGVRTGIMDQFAIGMGKESNAILINTESLNYEYIPLQLKDYSIVIMNTNKRRKLAGSMYNVRRGECEEGLEMLKQRYDISNLCELSVGQLPDIEEVIADENIRKRVIHVVCENYRVQKAVLAMRLNDLKSLGTLLTKSHESLRDFYEVTGKELDVIVCAAHEHEACLGARMTGAGFGGCAIALVKSLKCDDFIAHVKNRYDNETGLVSEFFISKSSDGPRLLEVL